MEHPFVRLLLLAAVLLSLPVAAEPLTKREVIDRLIESYGGESSLRKLNAVTQLWKMHSPVSRADGHDYRKILLPDHLLVELTYPSRTEKRLITRRGAYNGSGDSTFNPATDLQGDAMRLQLMRLYSPLTLRDRLPDLELRDDQDLCVLSLTSGQVRLDYLVNKANWHIEKVSGTMQMDGGDMQFLTEYSDFRLIDAVLMHHRENKFAGEMNTARLELLQAEIGLELGERDFPVPNGI